MKMERVLVSPETVTVLGNKVKATDPMWTGLDLSKAEPVTQSILMLAICGSEAPIDIHLRVPWDHPDDKINGIESGCVYRVRPKMEPGKRWKGHMVKSVAFERWDGIWWIAFETHTDKR